MRFIKSNMETKINIAEILKDKPNGIKLYSPLFGDVFLSFIGNHFITVKHHGKTANFYHNGRIYSYDESEPLLFPSKEMRSWEKFAWKKGDVLVSNDGKREVLFKTWINDSYTKFVGLHCLIIHDNEEVEYNNGTTVFNTNDFKGIEVEDAAQTYINTIEERLGGKLNLDTLEIEKETESKYNFKPFDKVLVRDSEEKQWHIDFFEQITTARDFPYLCLASSYKHCIPYNEKTKHLLGTTDEWEGGEE